MWKKIFGGGKTAREEKAPANQNPLYDRINWQRLPRHVAIIMDGNGRWAQGKGLIRTAGHKAGVKTLKNILKAAMSQPILFFTAVRKSASPSVTPIKSMHNGVAIWSPKRKIR